MARNLPAKAGHAGLIPGSGRSPGEGDINPLQLPGKSHGQRSLVGYSPGGHRVGHNFMTKMTRTIISHWERPSCWERLKAKGERGGRGGEG